MNSDGFHNEPVVHWARRNLQTPLEIKPLYSSRAGKVFTYLLLFIVPLAFIVTGVVAKLAGVGDQNAANGAFVCVLARGRRAERAIMLAQSLSRNSFVDSRTQKAERARDKMDEG